MPNDPWTDPDPQPGDFDDGLRALDPRYAERSQGSADARLTIIGDQQQPEERRASSSRTEDLPRDDAI